MALNNLTGQNIQDTYQKVVQTDGTNLADGTGSLLPISFNGNDVIISGSLTAHQYIVSSSVTNITIATLSGSTTFGNSTDDTHTFTGNITSSGTISSSLNNANHVLGGQLSLMGTTNGSIHLYAGGNLQTSLNSKGSVDSWINAGGNNLGIGTAEPTAKLHVVGNILATTNITASANISASGTITANNINGTINGGTF